MKALKIVVSIILAILFITYSMGFMLYRGVSNTILEEQYYHSIVQDYGLIGTVHSEMGTIVSDMVRDGMTGGAQITDPMQKAVIDSQVEFISKAITDALNEKWIGEQAKMITSDIAQVLSGDKRNISVVINLSDKISEIEQNISVGLEQFSDAELLAIYGAPKAFIPAIAQQIVEGLSLPPSIVISDIVDDMAPGTISLAKGYLGTLNTVFGILAIIVILVFFLICLLLWKVDGALQWVGLCGAIAGGIFLAFTRYFANLSRIENLSGMDMQSLPVESSSILNIITFTFSRMTQMPIIYLVAGIIVFIVGLLVQKKLRS